MEPQELAEAAEKAGEKGERTIGLSMAIFAVLLALATMMSHRAHTEEVFLETQATDQWNYYQAKNIRYHVYDADAEIAALFGDKGAAAVKDFKVNAEKQKSDSEKIQVVAEDLGKEVDKAGHQASYYDGGELFLEVAIVLSSISLLARSRIFWQSSFVFAALGLAAVLWGILRVH